MFMLPMNASYEKDLDLNLLRVFVVVAEARTVTAAANRLYLTQPAVSAALRRLSTAVGAPLFVRAGRGLELTARGKRLLEGARPHLAALVDAAMSPVGFDPKTSERVVRIGLSDSNESWLLPPLLAALSREAPRLRVVCIPVQFRTVADALTTSSVDFAVTVADDLPADVERLPLFTGGFVCVFDPRHVRVAKKRITLAEYLAQEHVIVSYNGDLRGIVEDILGLDRKVRLSVPSFHGIGSVIHDSPLVATLPKTIARTVLALHPGLRQVPTPFELGTSPMELLWRRAQSDDEALRFVRGLVVRIGSDVKKALASTRT
jgi:LysR family transcriptional activator of mexEF-oprN operon